MFRALRYYWVIAKGYRLCPWRSPYIRWRLETFFGKQADNLDARATLRLLWRERKRLQAFLRWVSERRHEQRRR